MTVHRRQALLPLLGLTFALVAAVLWVLTEPSGPHRTAASGGPVASAANDGTTTDLAATSQSEPRRTAPDEESDGAGSGPLPGETTTWSALVVMIQDEQPVEGATLTLHLLSPAASDEKRVLVTDADGRVGPVAIDFARHPAAQLSIHPGTRWASSTTTVRFEVGRENFTRIELRPQAGLEVRVVGVLDAQPVPSASVEVHDDVSGLLVQAACDPRGLARIPWTATGGPFTIRPRANGYVGLSWGELVGPPESDQDLELVVAPAGVLLVRVQDESGRALQGCRVSASLLNRSLAQGRGEARIIAARWEPPGETPPYYRFSEFPCDVRLIVQARTADGYEGQAQVQVNSSPGTAESTITVQRAQGTSIQVVDDRGAPIAGVTLGIDKPEEGVAEVLGATDETGCLSVVLQESLSGGVLWAYAEDRAMVWQTWTPDMQRVLLRMERDNGVSGIVVDSRGRPQRNVRVTPLLGERGDGFGVRHKRGQLLVTRLGGSTRGTDGSGEFALRGLPGRWVDLHVRPAKTSSFEVRDVLVGTRDLVITIPDEASLGIERGIALNVLVFDRSSGAAIPGSSLTVFHAPDGQSSSLQGGRGGTTGADGRVRITFADEGAYLVSALADGYVPYKSEIVEYPVGEHTITVELSPACELEIVLVDASGSRIPAYWISGVDGTGTAALFQHAESGGYMTGDSIMTDVQGIARANRMPPGTIRLLVHDERGRTSGVLLEHAVQLSAGRKARVELRLP